MAIELIILDRPNIPEDERTLTLPEQERIVIGRLEKKEGCDFTVRPGKVSRRHCEINYLRNINLYTVRDLGSTFGTFVEGQRIKDETPLIDGYTLSLAGVVRYKVRIR